MARAALGIALYLLVSVTSLAEETVLLRAALKLSPTTAPLVHRSNLSADAKLLTFVFYTGSLPINNEGTWHGWLIADGYMKPNDLVPLRGRGITFGHTHMCQGVGFERFADPNQFPPGCIEMDFEPWTFYGLEVYVDKDKVRVSIDGKSLVSNFVDSDIGDDTVMGVAGDRKPSTYGIFNLTQEIL